MGTLGASRRVLSPLEPYGIHSQFRTGSDQCLHRDSQGYCESTPCCHEARHQTLLGVMRRFRPKSSTLHRQRLGASGPIGLWSPDAEAERFTTGLPSSAELTNVHPSGFPPATTPSSLPTPRMPGRGLRVRAAIQHHPTTRSAALKLAEMSPSARLQSFSFQ
jgi:hypothetical protein